MFIIPVLGVRICCSSSSFLLFFCRFCVFFSFVLPCFYFLIFCWRRYWSCPPSLFVFISFYLSIYGIVVGFPAASLLLKKNKLFKVIHQYESLFFIVISTGTYISTYVLIQITFFILFYIISN
jgi:hypothetical protein